MNENKPNSGFGNPFSTPFHTHNGSDAPVIPFTNLGGVPSTYSGSAGKVLKVNSNENGLIFSSASSNVPYPGTISNTGTGLILPAGWSVALPMAGNFHVTHNLNTTSYVVVATASSGGIAQIVSQSSTVFIVATANFAGVQSSFLFNFILMTA